MENQKDQAKDQAKEQTPGVDNDQENAPCTKLIFGQLPQKEHKPLKMGTFPK